MRVLFLTNTFPPGYTGGAEIANYHACRGLIRQGVRCSILVVNNRMAEPSDEWYELGGISVHRVDFHTEKRRPVTDVFDSRVYRAVRAELHRLKPDLVHIQNVSGATLAPYIACRTMGVPVVNTLHDLWLLCPNNMLYRHDGSFCDPTQNPTECGNCFRRYDFWGHIPHRRAIFRALTSNVEVFISPSQAVIDRHVEAGYDARRFRLVRLGFEPDVPKELSHSGLRTVTDTAHRHHTVAFVGGGVLVKGTRVLLDAIPMMLRHVERLRIMVAGGGEKMFLDRFRQYAPAVQVLGWVPFKEIRALFAAADLSVIPSVWHENSPVVIFENFQVGTPVVGSAFGGIPEFIHEGETGYLFPRGDAAALAEKIILHFARPAHKGRHMRQRCVQEIQTRLTLEKHLEGTLQVYREVLGH
jgi:glycosyltransferase involved in cell wall biosynthesis